MAFDVPDIYLFEKEFKSERLVPTCSRNDSFSAKRIKAAGFAHELPALLNRAWERSGGTCSGNKWERSRINDIEKFE